MQILIEELYKNRLMRTNGEIEKFEKALNEISKVVKEEDIPGLCKVFNDNTRNDEVMFGLIHLIEIFSSEKAFGFIVLGVANMLEQASGWAKIIIYRCLNDDFARNMLKNAVNTAELQVQQKIVSLLNVIKEEDFDNFGMAVTEILS